MQQASFQDISSRSFQENIFGYGFENFGIVRDELKSIGEFSDNLRPTGPHNSFLFIVFFLIVTKFSMRIPNLPSR